MEERFENKAQGTEQLKRDVEAAQRVNKALADVPEEIEFGGRVFKLCGFTIKKILEIDTLIVELTDLLNRYAELRAKAEVEGLDAVRKDLIDTGVRVANKMAEAIAKILSAGNGEPIDPNWVMEHLDPTPNGNGVRILEAYRNKCNLVPFLEALMASKQF